MTKKELIVAVAGKTGATQKDVSKFLDAVYEATAEALKAGDKVVLGDFGVFKVVEKPERICTSPATGQKVKVAAHRSTKLSVSKKLKDEFC